MILKLCEYWTISVVKYSMILELCEYLTWPPAMEMKTVILEVHECMNLTVTPWTEGMILEVCEYLTIAPVVDGMIL